MKNLNQMKPGTWFSAKIEDTQCTGVIQIEGKDAFLCQNKKDGSRCQNRIGFEYSWTVGVGNGSALSYHEISDFKLLKKAPKKTPKIHIDINQFGNYDVEYSALGITVGCTFISKEQISAVYAKFFKKSRKKIKKI